MIQHETPIARFFRSFIQKSSEENIPAQVSQFAGPFICADPHGIRCVRLEDFATALPKRKLLFDQLGCKPAVLVKLNETQLDGRYVLAKTTWRMDFPPAESRDAEQLLVDSTFLVDTGGEKFKIVVYMAHQDIMQAGTPRSRYPAGLTKLVRPFFRRMQIPSCELQKVWPIRRGRVPAIVLPKRQFSRHYSRSSRRKLGSAQVLRTQ